MESDKINVLFITHADKKGGAEQSLIHLINYLDTSIYSIHLLSPVNANYLGEIRAEYKHFALTLGSIKQRAGLGYAGTIAKIRAYVRRHHIHIVHANGWRAPWYAAPLRLMISAKLVWHHRDHTDQKMFNRVLPRFFDQVICISDFVAGSIQGSNKTVIYNGVDPMSVRGEKQRSFMEDNTLVIGTFGRIVEWKRYHLVIRAVKKLADSGRMDWRLLIVGDASVDGSDSYYDDMMNQVLDWGLEHNVEFTGYSPKPLEVMRECDLTVNFSHNEPFGRVIIESMLAQTPVIVSDSGGAPEIIHRTKGGFIVRDGDVDELYETIRQVYDHSVNVEEMSKQGYLNVMQDFNMSAIARKVEQTYMHMLAPGLQPETAR